MPLEAVEEFLARRARWRYRRRQRRWQARLLLYRERKTPRTFRRR